MAFTMNKICRACKLKDRCDEDALMRSYVTSADENGCPKYKSILDMEESDAGFAEMLAESAAHDERRRQMEEASKREIERQQREEEQAEFKEQNDEYKLELFKELGELAEALDELEQSCGPKEPTPDMDYDRFREVYSAWSLRRTFYAMHPIHSDLAQQYLKFLNRYKNTKDDKEIARIQDERLNSMRLSYIDEALKNYRDYGLSGEGAQNEEIHKYALELQSKYDADVKREEEEAKQKAEEERKREEEEAKAKEEIKRQKAEEKKRKAKEEEERRKIEDEQDRIKEEAENKKNKKISLIFWGIWLVTAIVLFSIVEEWWAYVLVVLGLIVAAVIKWFVWLLK